MLRIPSRARNKAPFWKAKALDEMTPEEWESLCDGCGKCCLHKLKDPLTEAISYTNVACRLLDIENSRCRNYPERQTHVPDCLSLRNDCQNDMDWLPSTCAYRRVSEGKDLLWWHPLLTGDRNSVHRAGRSVRGRAIPERKAQRLTQHVVDWPR